MRVAAELAGIFTWNCTLKFDGRSRGKMGFGWGRGGTIQLGGRSFDVASQGMFSGRWELRQGSTCLASANKSGWLARFHLDLEAGEFEVAREGVFSNAFAVKDGGRTVGRLRPPGLFSRGVAGDVPDSWAESDAAFVMWLVMMVRRRRARSSSS